MEMKLDMLHGDVKEMRDALKDVAAAITRLAVVEERQTQTAAAQERAFAVISTLESKFEKVDDRLKRLEELAVASKQTNHWVEKGLWAAGAAGATYIAKKVGLL
jgi:hypothetical protein